MTCHDHRSDNSQRDSAAAAADMDMDTATPCHSRTAGRTSRTAGRTSRTTGRRFAVWTTVACALLTLQLTAAASTGGRDGDAMAAVGSDARPATVVAAAADPVAAESKKLTAGKASAMDGYVLTGSDHGDKGYNEDDAFGGKDSDSYGFGTQVSYGSKAGDGGDGAYHHTTAYDDGGRSNPKYSAWHFEDKDGKPTKRYVYDSLDDGGKKKKDPYASEAAEASEYDSVEAYDDADDGTHAGYEADDAEPEYGNLYDSADVYNDADTYY